MQYKVIHIESHETVDEKLTYDEAMLYSGADDVLVMAQDADVDKAFRLIHQIGAQQ